MNPEIDRRRLDLLKNEVIELSRIVTALTNNMGTLEEKQAQDREDHEGRLGELETALTQLRADFDTHIESAFPDSDIKSHNEDHVKIKDTKEFWRKVRWQIWQATINLMWPAIILAVGAGVWTYWHPPMIITNADGTKTTVTTPLPGTKP